LAGLVCFAVGIPLTILVQPVLGAVFVLFGLFCLWSGGWGPDGDFGGSDAGGDGG